jgi:hypothetical protein
MMLLLFAVAVIALLDKLRFEVDRAGQSDDMGQNERQTR